MSIYGLHKKCMEIKQTKKVQQQNILHILHRNNCHLQHPVYKMLFWGGGLACWIETNTGHPLIIASTFRVLFSIICRMPVHQYTDAFVWNRSMVQEIWGTAAPNHWGCVTCNLVTSRISPENVEDSRMCLTESIWKDQDNRMLPCWKTLCVKAGRL